MGSESENLNRGADIQSYISAKTILALRSALNTLSRPHSIEARKNAFVDTLSAMVGTNIDVFFVKRGRVSHVLPGHEITAKHHAIAKDKALVISDEESPLYVFKIPLDNKEQVVLASKKPLAEPERLDATSEIVKRLAEEFNLTGRVWPIKKIVVVGLLVTTLFVPVTLPITGEGIAKGEGRIAIASLNAGIVYPLVNAGMVEKGEIIAKVLSSDIEQSIQNLEAKAAEMQSNLANPAESDGDIYRTRAALRSTQVELAGLKAQNRQNSIVSPTSGIIEWNESIVGKYVAIGEAIGSVGAVEQTLLTVRIDAKVWRPLEGVTGVYIANDASQGYVNGEVVSAPSIVHIDQGKTQFEVGFRLEESVVLGSTGNVSFPGKKNTLFALLFKTPINYLKAWLALPSD